MSIYHPDSSLELNILSSIEQWEATRDEWWNANVQEGFVSLAALADELADALIEATDALIAPHEVRGTLGPLFTNQYHRIHELLEKTDLQRWALERLEIHVARRYCVGSRDMAERCYRLSTLVLEREPSEAVLRYLQRLSRCYIASFDSEAVVMCRAVLENAIRDTFQRANEEPPPEMRARLERAVDRKWLSRPAQGSAWTVWKRGNTAVHNDPSVVRDALSTIEMTLAVLQELYGEGEMGGTDTA